MKTCQSDHFSRSASIHGSLSDPLLRTYECVRSVSRPATRARACASVAQASSLFSLSFLGIAIGTTSSRGTRHIALTYFSTSSVAASVGGSVKAHKMTDPANTKRKHTGEHDVTVEKRKKGEDTKTAVSKGDPTKGSDDKTDDGTKRYDAPPSSLGRAAAEGIALVNALKNAGADHDLQLPRIVFAGKQSAGKSSLVEAVTGIVLPRAHGTCTKCPIEVTTERVEQDDSDFWECEVSLRIMFREDGVRHIIPILHVCSNVALSFYFKSCPNLIYLFVDVLFPHRLFYRKSWSLRKISRFGR